MALVKFIYVVCLFFAHVLVDACFCLKPLLHSTCRCAYMYMYVLLRGYSILLSQHFMHVSFLSSMMGVLGHGHSHGGGGGHGHSHGGGGGHSHGGSNGGHSHTAAGEGHKHGAGGDDHKGGHSGHSHGAGGDDHKGGDSSHCHGAGGDDHKGGDSGHSHGADGDEHHREGGSSGHSREVGSDGHKCASGGNGGACSCKEDHKSGGGRFVSLKKKVHVENINVQAAFIHVIGDLIQSVGVVIAGYIIKFKVCRHCCVYLMHVSTLYCGHVPFHL